MGKPKTPGSVKMAEKFERGRQMQMQGNESAVNKIYDSPERQAQYGQFLQAMRNDYTRGLDRSHAAAGRKRKFGMARRGLIGGSADADSARDLREAYLTELLGAERNAQAATENLKGTDFNARQAMLGLARGGADTATAGVINGFGTMAGAQMNNYMAPAQALSGFLDTAGKMYKARTEANEKARGESAFQG
jgi:hypothetical protein